MAFQPRTPCMGEGMIVCMQRTPVLVLTYPELEITHHKANIFSIVHYHSLLFIIAIIRIIIGTVIIIFLMMINQEQVNINLSGGLRLGKYPSNKSMFFMGSLQCNISEKDKKWQGDVELGLARMNYEMKPMV